MMQYRKKWEETLNKVRNTMNNRRRDYNNNSRDNHDYKGEESMNMIEMLKLQRWHSSD